MQIHKKTAQDRLEDLYYMNAWGDELYARRQLYLLVNLVLGSNGSEPKISSSEQKTAKKVQTGVPWYDYEDDLIR